MVEEIETINTPQRFTGNSERLRRLSKANTFPTLEFPECCNGGGGGGRGWGGGVNEMFFVEIWIFSGTTNC